MFVFVVAFGVMGIAGISIISQELREKIEELVKEVKKLSKLKAAINRGFVIPNRCDEHQCDNCGEYMSSPERFIWGGELYDLYAHVELTITSESDKRTYIFCNYDCLITWFKEQFVPKFECKNHEDANE
jgi:hypothetical protein